MKVLITCAIFLCFAFPAFSQSAVNIQRYRALSDAIGATLTRSTAVLADFDARANDDGTTRRYAQFFRRHRDLTRALHESEHMLNFYLRGHAHNSIIREEHRNFRNLLVSLEELKNEYDAWLRTVQ